MCVHIYRSLGVLDEGEKLDGVRGSGEPLGALDEGQKLVEATIRTPRQCFIGVRGSNVSPLGALDAGRKLVEAYTVCYGALRRGSRTARCPRRE